MLLGSSVEESLTAKARRILQVPQSRAKVEQQISAAIEVVVGPVVDTGAGEGSQSTWKNSSGFDVA